MIWFDLEIEPAAIAAGFFLAISLLPPQIVSAATPARRRAVKVPSLPMSLCRQTSLRLTFFRSARSRCRFKLKSANFKSCLFVIYNLPSDIDPGDRRVEIRIVPIPELRIGNGNMHGEMVGSLGRDGLLAGFGIPGLFAVRIRKLHSQPGDARVAADVFRRKRILAPRSILRFLPSARRFS